MKAIKSLLAASALATVAGAANATLWNVDMTADVYFAAANGPLTMAFSGQWDDATNAGTWTGTTSIPAFKTTMHYTQTFVVNELTGGGNLAALDQSSCTANTDSACTGLGGALSGPLWNTPNPADYKTKAAFTPANGWTGQWTLQVYKSVPVPGSTDGSTMNQYLPMPFDVTLTAVPVPAAAWLFGSGLLGLAGVSRRRRNA